MIALIVLAAGKSTRMEGHNKLLAEIQGKPMIRRVVEAAIRSKVDEIIVVLGWDEARVREVLAGLRCRLVVNKDFEKGQSSSLKTGLNEVNLDTSAVLVLPGDIAEIDYGSIDKVVNSYILNDGTILVAAHNGRHGHPILIDRKLFKDVAQISEETSGLKSVIKNHENEIRLVEVGTDNILRDVDTPEDLRRLASLAREY
jgi:molybdenum cofactor cytidylyltransferase